MTVKMGGTLPHGEHNGLAAELPDLLRNPKQKRVVIAVIDVVKIAEDVESGDRTPQVRVRRVEVIGQDDLALAHRLLQRAWESRSGDDMLPMEMEDELNELFDGVDLTGDDEDVPGDGPVRDPDLAERAAGDDTLTDDDDAIRYRLDPSDNPDLPDDYDTPDDEPIPSDDEPIPSDDDLFKQPQPH